ncbi:MAG: 30S ribosomal protein S27e [Candidatus Aenigmarchaeota archaeon ex4484_56]|nr:MAG: 30S ribosomal protein S27e [Candidatus Aenigmarchaeota archaeon ex4484_56]
MVSSKFLKIVCKCGEERIVFNKASTKVFCNSCNKLIVNPTGGKAKIYARVINSFE